MKLSLVDKREIFPEGLSRLLASQPGIEMVGACGPGTKATENVGQLMPAALVPMITASAFLLLPPSFSLIDRNAYASVFNHCITKP
jgi:hypothetical protein